MEITGFEPVASRMQSERSTTELYPLATWAVSVKIGLDKKASFKIGFKRVGKF